MARDASPTSSSPSPTNHNNQNDTNATNTTAGGRAASPIMFLKDEDFTSQSIQKKLRELVDSQSPAKSERPAERVRVQPKGVTVDCLDATEKTHTTATYAARKVSPTKKGFSFGSPSKEGGKFEEKRFISGDLAKHQFLGTQSPGPKYSPISFTDHPHKPQSFPRAERMRPSSRGEIPGPKYDIPSTIGPPHSSAPAYRMGPGERFQEGVFISSSHSKGLPARDTPAPNAYSPDAMGKREGAAFSFTSGRNVKPGKLFISKEHAEHDSFGVASPGPQYNWNVRLISERAPAFSFGGAQNRPSSTPAGGRTSSPRSDGGSRAKPNEPTPGPGAYSPEHNNQEGPAFSFGVLENANATRFYSRALVQNKGAASPGPQYYPKDYMTHKGAPAFSFADKDPMVALLAPRWPDKQYFSAEMSRIDFAGRESPGPATYDTTQGPGGPAFTMAQREKILMKRICPAPERARFISKELAKENMGAYSPGPKYKVPDSIGGPGSIKWSFGSKDRVIEELEGRSGEKGRGRDTRDPAARGAASPGPKYEPKHTLVEPRAPAHHITGRWSDKEAKPTKEEYDDERKRVMKHPQVAMEVQARHKKAPVCAFGKSRRGLAKEDDDGKVLKAIMGRDSPGPVYKPNFTAVDPKGKSVSFGGLR